MNGVGLTIPGAAGGLLDIQAERPMLVTPEQHSRLLLENFGEKAAEFAEWLRRPGPGRPNLKLLKYGFQFRRSDLSESVTRDSLASVGERVCAQVSAAQDDAPLSTVIQGVEDAWEVCLLKFTIDLVQGSAPENLGDLRRRGLI